jgi:hypothetical protein
MTKVQKALIIIFLIIGLITRLYHLNSPVADWHSFRQADTASVTDKFIRLGINLLVPTYHDLSNVQSGQENPKGYRMVEFPIYNLISTYFHNIFGSNTDVSSRLVSIIFSLGSAFLIFLICYQQTKLFLPSLLPMLVFLYLPFNIYYSRTILPEPTAVFFLLLSLYLFQVNIFYSAIFLSISILVKPYTAIIELPTFALFTFQKYSKSIKLKTILQLILFAAITITPFFLWRKWIGQFPEGIPKSDWLLNNSDSTTFPNWYHGYDLTFLNKMVAFRPHWFNWLFKERLANLILGTFGVIPLFLGLAYKKNRTQIFSFSLILGILLYFIFIAQGNIQHDYYQVLIVPFISIITGFGLYYIYKFLFQSHFLSLLSIFFVVCLSTYFSWDQVIGYYQINNPNIITAGAAAKKLLPPDSLIIAPYTGDTALLYQTGLSGWPVEVYDIDNILTNHPRNPLYLVSVNYDTYTNTLIPKYPVITRNPEFIILKLSK